MMNYQDIERLVLELDISDRERLMASLANSIDHPQLSDIEQAWVDEAEERLDEVLDGKVKGIPGDEFFDRVKRDLGWN